MGSPPADLAPAAIQRRLRSRTIGRSLEVHAEAGSTNDLAMAAGAAGVPDGHCVLADRQSAGRGRLSRRWESPGGLGLYVSIVLRPPVPVAQAPFLTVVAGVAVCDALSETAAVSPGLKWPNDVLLDGRKVAGILSELAASGSAIRHVVVGIGINLNHRSEDFPEELQPLAGSLFLATGRPFPRDAVAAALFNHFDRLYALFCAGERRVLVEAARQRSVVLGRRVALIDGKERWEGHAVDLDEDGALLVRDAAGVVRCVHAGDVSLRAAEREAKDQGPMKQ